MTVKAFHRDLISPVGLRCQTGKLEAEPLKQVDDWLDPYRQFWEDCLDRLGEYLPDVQAEKQQPDRKI